MKQVDVLAIAAHPDDIELICGGTLIRAHALGRATGILDLAAGELASRGTPELRAKEAAKAAKVMGVAVRETVPDWVLDQIGIETMFANRVAMGRGLNAPRFRWVAFDDALMFPLNNEAARRSNPDYRGFYPGEERLLKRYLTDLKIGALPPSSGLRLLFGSIRAAFQFVMQRTLASSGTSCA